MAQALRDWLGPLQTRIDRMTQSREGLAQAIQSCIAAMQDMRPAYEDMQRQWIAIQGIRNTYHQVYVSRFGESEPDQPSDQPIPTTVLETPEQRRDAIRKTAQRIAAPNSNVTDSEVLRALKSEGMDLTGGNPTAIISTVLNGFKEEFEKVKGEKGEFRRKGHAETIQHTIAT